MIHTLSSCPLRDADWAAATTRVGRRHVRIAQHPEELRTPRWQRRPALRHHLLVVVVLTATTAAVHDRRHRDRDEDDAEDDADDDGDDRKSVCDDSDRDELTRYFMLVRQIAFANRF